MFSTIFTWLASFLSGPLINGALDAYKAKLAAGTDADKMAADLAAKQILLDQREAELNQATIVAEQGNWLTRSVRPAFCIPFLCYLWKIVLWDKVLGLGVTDTISPDLKQIMLVIIVSYFGGRTLEKVATRITR